MTRTPDTKTVVAVREHDDDQSGNYLGAGAMKKTNDANNSQHIWRRQAEITLARRAASGETFTAHDLRDDGLGEPDNPAMWGSLFRQAQMEGLIVTVGVLNSKRAQRHGSLSRVWVGAHGAGIAA